MSFDLSSDCNPWRIKPIQLVTGLWGLGRLQGVAVQGFSARLGAQRVGAECDRLFCRVVVLFARFMAYTQSFMKHDSLCHVSMQVEELIESDHNGRSTNQLSSNVNVLVKCKVQLLTTVLLGSVHVSATDVANAPLHAGDVERIQ